MIFADGDAKEQVEALVAALKKDGYDFSVGIPADTPISQAERVVSAGKGIGEKKNMKLIEALASVSHELIRLSTGHTIYHMDTKENRVVHRGVFELTEYDVMLQEVLETVADKSEYRVLDYILERGIIHRFAKVIFITYDANRDAAFEIERLEKGIVLYV